MVAQAIEPIHQTLVQTVLEELMVCGEQEAVVEAVWFCYDGKLHRWCPCESCKLNICAVCDAVRDTSDSPKGAK
jgi:hypothetical protein